MDIRRKLGTAMERAGYVKYRNPKRADGRWYPERGMGVTIYGKVGATPLSEMDFQALLERVPF